RSERRQPRQLCLHRRDSLDSKRKSASEPEVAYSRNAPLLSLEGRCSNRRPYRFETSTQRPVPRGGRYRLCARVKERVERFPWFTDDSALLAEVELVEE